MNEYKLFSFLRYVTVHENISAYYCWQMDLQHGMDLQHEQPGS